MYCIIQHFVHLSIIIIIKLLTSCFYSIIINISDSDTKYTRIEYIFLGGEDMNLKQARKVFGLSQTVVAEWLHTHVQTYISREKGKTALTEPEQIILLKKFNEYATFHEIRPITHNELFLGCQVLITITNSG